MRLSSSRLSVKISIYSIFKFLFLACCSPLLRNAQRLRVPFASDCTNQIGAPSAVTLTSVAGARQLHLAPSPHAPAHSLSMRTFSIALFANKTTSWPAAKRRFGKTTGPSPRAPRKQRFPHRESRVFQGQHGTVAVCEWRRRAVHARRKDNRRPRGRAEGARIGQRVARAHDNRCSPRPRLEGPPTAARTK